MMLKNKPEGFQYSQIESLTGCKPNQYELAFDKRNHENKTALQFTNKSI